MMNGNKALNKLSLWLDYIIKLEAIDDSRQGKGKLSESTKTLIEAWNTVKHITMSYEFIKFYMEAESKQQKLKAIVYHQCVGSLQNNDYIYTFPGVDPRWYWVDNQRNITHKHALIITKCPNCEEELSK